jgi:hypothetical protein
VTKAVPQVSIMERGAETLRREGYAPLAIAVPAVQASLRQPEYVVALVRSRYPKEWEVMQADAEGVTTFMTSDSLLDAYGSFVTLLYVGDPEHFDTTQRGTF